MQFQLIMGLVIAGLIVLYVYLKKTKGHQESNLPVVNMPNPPAVSEDVNLPVASNPIPPITNELDNNGPQHQ